MKLRTFLATVVAGAALAATGMAPAVAETAAPHTPAANCYVDSNGTLHCANGASDLRSEPYFRAPVVSRLNTTYSYFSCWTSGDPHSGGNDIWYYTDGDDGGHGFLPAQRVFTPQDPMPGMYHC
ncbi:hypothetical protein ACIBSV_41500 [Embleya sp. NPDC050154]|uniref:hypothetical protein n=1 Tax=unclassified Embleya TaxID=2699296 RepID=UPI0037AD025A